MADDAELLALRGGGPRGYSRGGQCGQRTLGGGVSAFLDSDYETEAWELAELERRRQEVIIDSDPRAAITLHPIIYGEVNGARTIICSLCARDIPFARGQWWRCRCGRGRCTTCISCPCGADANPQPVPQTNEEADPENELVHMWGLADAHDPQPSHEEGTVQDDPPRGGDGCAACFACGKDLWSPGAEWRICRCSLSFCVTCARGPCDGCGAETVYDDRQCVEEHWPEPPLPRTESIEDEVDVAGFTELYLHEPEVYTPAGALARRNQMMKDEADRKTRARAENRQLRSQQVREGRRPPRRSERRDTISIVTANVTAAESWYSEMRHGQLLKEADFTAIQEHRLGPGATETASGLLRSVGCDSEIQEGYWKEQDYGGGTAITARQWSGVRPLPLCGRTEAKLHLEGRFTSGVVDIFGGILLGSVYGISGLDTKRQLDLWYGIALHVRTHGLPFILAGDWQVPPAEMQAAGLPALLGAQIVATSTPTNVHTKRVLDYFLVAKSVADMVIDVKAIAGTRLATHLPVELTLRGRRSLGEAMRVTKPPTLDVFPPTNRWPLACVSSGATGEQVGTDLTLRRVTDVAKAAAATTSAASRKAACATMPCRSGMRGPSANSSLPSASRGPRTRRRTSAWGAIPRSSKAPLAHGGSACPMKSVSSATVSLWWPRVSASSFCGRPGWQEEGISTPMLESHVMQLEPWGA